MASLRFFVVLLVSFKRGTPAAAVFLAEILPPGFVWYGESISLRAQTINSTFLFLEGVMA
jgi:hypothetical protein